MDLMRPQEIAPSKENTSLSSTIGATATRSSLSKQPSTDLGKSVSELLAKFRDKLGELRQWLQAHARLPYCVIYSSLDEAYFFFHMVRK